MQQLFSDQPQEETVPASQLEILGEMGEKSITAVFLGFYYSLPDSRGIWSYQCIRVTTPVSLSQWSCYSQFWLVMRLLKIFSSTVNWTVSVSHGSVVTSSSQRVQQAGGDSHHDKSGEAGHCSHQFCINIDYKKLELPPPNNGSVVQVVITPHILEIFEVEIVIVDQMSLLT